MSVVFTGNTYFFASCKEWHRPLFESLVAEGGADWVWVDSPAALDQELLIATPRYIFFLHWSWIVPARIWQANECVCFHMTDVPYGRGGSPLQNLIQAGHKGTKLTALQMVAEVDAGPVYAKCSLPLDGTAQEIYVRAGQLSVDTIRWMVRAQPVPVAQTGEVVHFNRRTPDQSKIPKDLEMERIYDFIRMLDAEGYPYAFLEVDGYRLEFRNARVGGLKVEADVSISLIK